MGCAKKSGTAHLTAFVPGRAVLYPAPTATVTWPRPLLWPVEPVWQNYAPSVIPAEAGIENRPPRPPNYERLPAAWITK